MVSLTKLFVDVPVEGDYSAYTQKWISLELPTNWNWYFAWGSHFIPDETKAMILSSEFTTAYGYLIVDVSDGAYTQSLLSLTTPVKDADHSFLGKYTVIIDEQQEGFVILKDGVLLETHDLIATYNHCGSCVISQSGKYIILIVRRDADGKWFLLCYEGA